MWPTLLFVLLVACLGRLDPDRSLQRRRIRALERSKEEIQVEETLVFDFLHGLGEAFRETIRPNDLHRLIVEGATRILDAHGGALYLVDRTGTKLVPAFISKGCPPLVDVPAHILQQAAVTRSRSKVIFGCTRSRPGEGLLGRVWQSGQPVYLNEFSDAPELAKLRDSALATASVMVTPLLYGKQNLGVLALGNGPMGAPFTQSDFVVFKSISEQSAFALYNAIIYSEANEKKRLDHDLEIAREIQRILLPDQAADIAGFEIAGMNIPARQVSGDYFDYIKVDDKPTRRRHRRRFRQRRARFADHGDLPQRLAQPGRAKCLAVAKCCGRSIGSSIPTSRKTCSSAWPTSCSITARMP